MVLRSATILPLFFLITVFTAASQTSPEISFTQVPDWGQKGVLKGKVHHAVIAQSGVAVYIFVEEAGGWWTKPLISSPVSPIQSDSTFSVNISIGGLDDYATRIIAFLIPVNWQPPILEGAELPPSLFAFPSELAIRPHGSRMLVWSGLEWIVKRSVGNGPLPIGPGPNIFNDRDSMVWTDAQDRLHMRIAKTGSKWHCSEVICRVAKGYGRYSFKLSSRVDLLDPGIIAGIFTWDDGAPFSADPDPYYREIDFEFSRWGVPGNQNSQYVIQPWNVGGNLHRFNMMQTSSDISEHSFTWTSDSVAFTSRWGDEEHRWTFSAKDRIPHPGEAALRINFHLLNGLPPSGAKGGELILDDYRQVSSIHELNPVKAWIYPNPSSGDFTLVIPGQGERAIMVQLYDFCGRKAGRCFQGVVSGTNPCIAWSSAISGISNISAGSYFLEVRESGRSAMLKVIIVK
jgi:hypothetical protein